MHEGLLLDGLESSKVLRWVWPTLAVPYSVRSNEGRRLAQHVLIRMMDYSSDLTFVQRHLRSCHLVYRSLDPIRSRQIHSIADRVRRSVPSGVFRAGWTGVSARREIQESARQVVAVELRMRAQSTSF